MESIEIESDFESFQKNLNTIFTHFTESYDLSDDGDLSVVVYDNNIYLNCHMDERMIKNGILRHHEYRYCSIKLDKNDYCNKEQIVSRFFRNNKEVLYFCDNNQNNSLNEQYLFAIYNIADKCLFEVPLDGKSDINYDYAFLENQKLNLLAYEYEHTNNDKPKFNYFIIQIDLNDYHIEKIEMGNIFDENKEIADKPKGYCYFNNKLYIIYVRSVYEYDFETKINRLLCTTNIQNKVTGISVIDDVGIYIFAETYNDDMSYLYYYNGAELEMVLTEEYKRK